MSFILSKRSRRTTKTNRAERVVLTVEDLRKLLGIGRPAAYDVARKIGRRVGGRRGRLLISREALDAWLRGENVGVAS